MFMWDYSVQEEEEVERLFDPALSTKSLLELNGGQILSPRRIYPPGGLLYYKSSKTAPVSFVGMPEEELCRQFVSIALL